MNIEQRLNQVADRYRAQGYTVSLRPRPEELPAFASDFNVEIMARRDDGGVVASAKKSLADLEADRELPRYAEVTEKQPGWRFDVIVLAPESPPALEKREAKEPSEEDVRRAIDDVERMLETGFVQQALIAAWAVLETAMRRKLRAGGEEAVWGSSPRTMLNELYSDGALQSSVFRQLEGLYHARNAIVHGFTPPVVENSAVQFLVETARMLLEESRAAKRTA